MKKLTTGLLALSLVISSATLGMAASAKCTVTEIKDNLVTIECGDQAGKMKIGDNLKIKIDNKKMVEGC